MKYFLVIQYVVEKKSKELKNKFEENRDYELKKHLNKDYMDNTLNRKYDKKKEEKIVKIKKMKPKMLGNILFLKLMNLIENALKIIIILKKKLSPPKKIRTIN